jgi:hypothetical protein
MRQVGIIPLGRILIIETNAEQIRTNTFFVLQLQNVRQNVVCDRGSSVVGKPFTTVLVPPVWNQYRRDRDAEKKVSSLPGLRRTNTGRTQAKTGGESNISLARTSICIK